MKKNKTQECRYGIELIVVDCNRYIYGPRKNSLIMLDTQFVKLFRSPVFLLERQRRDQRRQISFFVPRTSSHRGKEEWRHKRIWHNEQFDFLSISSPPGSFLFFFWLPFSSFFVCFVLLLIVFFLAWTKQKSAVVQMTYSCFRCFLLFKSFIFTLK